MNIRTKLFLDLFVNFWTVVPTIVGGSLLMLSFAVENGMLFTLGLGGVLFAVSAGVFNAFWNFSNATNAALEKHAEQQEAERNQKLDTLNFRLENTKGKEDEQALQNLRKLYDGFHLDIKTGKISENVPPATISLIDEIFDACIARLSMVADLYEQGQNMTGDFRKQLTAQRKSLVDQVQDSIMELLNTMNEVRAIKFKTQQQEMSRLQTRLQSQLDVAKEISGLDSGSDTKDYSEYEQYSE